MGITYSCSAVSNDNQLNLPTLLSKQQSEYWFWTAKWKGSNQQ